MLSIKLILVEPLCCRPLLSPEPGCRCLGRYPAVGRALVEANFAGLSSHVAAEAV